MYGADNGQTLGMHAGLMQPRNGFSRPAITFLAAAMVHFRALLLQQNRCKWGIIVVANLHSNWFIVAANPH
jgi:hypothetical protein